MLLFCNFSFIIKSHNKYYIFLIKKLLKFHSQKNVKNSIAYKNFIKNFIFIYINI